MATTVNDIITLALIDSGVLGVGQVAQAEDLNNALFRANMMLSQWDRQRWLVYHLVETSCPCTGAASYTLGTGGNLNIPRLDLIDSAYVRDSSNTDTPLRIIHSREEFTRIQEKNETGSPFYMFYDSGNPTGDVYLWPIINNTFTLFIDGKSLLQQFTSLTDAIDLPPEYLEAIYSNLIVRLRAAYRMPVDEYFTSLALSTLDVLQKANLQDSNLRMPKIEGRSVGDLINLALEDSGAFSSDKPPSYQDTLDGLWRANMMLSQWDRERWLVYHLIETSCACTGATSYTLGTGGDLNTPRLDKIDAAFVRDGSGNDTSLRIMHSFEEFARIQEKGETGSPFYVFYDSGNPTGNVYVWPIASSSFTLFVQGKSILQQFATMADTLDLPPEYEQAIYSNLVICYQAAYQIPPNDYYVNLAGRTLDVLKKANLQDSMLRAPKVEGRSVGDLINMALEDSGVFSSYKLTVGPDGTTIPGVPRPISYQDTLDGLWRLNMMLAQWNRKRWLIYHLVDVSVVTTGVENYTIGPGEQFNTPRPDRIEDGCFLRQVASAGTQQIDYPLELLPSREDYNRIRLKTMGTWPSVIFYDSNWPTGLIYAWPVPQANLYELHILVKSQLSQLTDISQTVNLPPEYEAAISYNLQVRTRSAYGMSPDPVIIQLAKESLNVIRGANVQVPSMKMPPSVIGAQRSYNVYSDGY